MLGWSVEKFVRPKAIVLLGCSCSGRVEAGSDLPTVRAKQQRMLDFATEVLGNREHQFIGRQINEALRPLRDEYLASLQPLAESNLEIAYWHARRSDFGWCKTLSQILAVLSDPRILRRCLHCGSGPGWGSSGVAGGSGAQPNPGGSSSSSSSSSSSGGQSNNPDRSSSVSQPRSAPSPGGQPNPGCSSSGGLQPSSGSSSATQHDRPGCSSMDTAENILALRALTCAHIVTHVASQYAWYMMMYTYCMPEGLAAVLQPDEVASKSAMSRVRATWENVQKLSRSAAAQPRYAGKLSEDIYWAHSNVLVHEAMLICQENEWKHSSDAVRKMAYDMWAGVGDTKRVLEDVFAALKNVSTRSKNGHISSHHAYFEACYAKVLHGGQPGLQQLRSSELRPRRMLSQTLPAADWCVPLCVPLKAMKEGMYRTSPDHVLPEVLAAEDILAKKPRVPWRPAGPAAIMRMTAATLYCNAEVASEWQHAAQAWCGNLLSRGSLFLDTRDQSVFLSLGFQKWVALGVPLQTVQCGGSTYFVLPGGLQQLATSQGGLQQLTASPSGLQQLAAFQPRVVVNHSVTDESHFRGILVECMAPSQVPEALAKHGIVWRQVQVIGLVRHAILKQVVMTIDTLSSIARAWDIRVTRRPGEKGITKRAYTESLVEHFFGDDLWQTRQELAHHCMTGPLPVASALDEATDLLDEENMREFETAPQEAGGPAPAEPAAVHEAEAAGPPPSGAAAPDAVEAPEPPPVAAAAPAPAGRAPPKAQVEDQRRKAKKAIKHGPQLNFTGAAVKELVPGSCMIPGVYLVWRRTISQWEARYYGALPRASLSVTWGGRRQLTELEALCEVIDWMWLQHEQSQNKKDTDVVPTLDVIMRALTDLHHEWDLRAPSDDHDAAPAAEPPVEAAAAPAADAHGRRGRGQVRRGGRGRGRGRGKGVDAAALVDGGLPGAVVAAPAADGRGRKRGAPAAPAAKARGCGRGRKPKGRGRGPAARESASGDSTGDEGAAAAAAAAAAVAQAAAAPNRDDGDALMHELFGDEA